MPAALLWQARQLAAPPPGLKLSYAPARVRGADETVATLSVSDETAGLRIDLRATRSPDGAASLTVSPLDAASEQPLAGTRVALAEASGRLLETTTVRAAGVARFEAVAPGHYLIRLQRQGSTWEIPISVVGESGIRKSGNQDLIP